MRQLHCLISPAMGGGCQKLWLICHWIILLWLVIRKIFILIFELIIFFCYYTVKELGRFHGHFYGLKLSEPAKFEEIKNLFEEARFRRETTSWEWDTILRIGPKRATRSVRNDADASARVPVHFLEKLEQVLEDPFNYGRKMVQPMEPLAIICHGDFLRNNIAFKYDQPHDNVATNAMMFDFQTVRYASPMIDLSSFMANSTGIDVRSKHFDYIFSTYYSELISTVLCTIDSDNMPNFLT